MNGAPAVRGGRFSEGSEGPAPDLNGWVWAESALSRLVVQPRMGMADPIEMAAGLAAVRAARVPAVATVTLDSYTRTGDLAGARRALEAGGGLNGYPLLTHPLDVTRRMLQSARGIPVQIRHGSPDPRQIFAAMPALGLSSTEGGPVSYCLPYSRTPLTDAISWWKSGTQRLVAESAELSLPVHIETFGGCMLGQLCPPSLLVAISVLEAMFFRQQGVRSISLSYAQQTHVLQDIDALRALRSLARRFLPDVDWHVVLYTYMGVYPSTGPGARLLLETSARTAVAGGAQRLIVKTTAEARRIPTIHENVAALRTAHRSAVGADPPKAGDDNGGEVHAEAVALIDAVLDGPDDVGRALLAAFRRGVLDVPFCLHDDNRGLTQGTIDSRGYLAWARTGVLPLPPVRRSTVKSVTSAQLLTLLRHTAEHHDRLGAICASQSMSLPSAARSSVAVVGTGPRGIAVIERLVARATAGKVSLTIEAIDAVEVGAGRIWRADQPPWLLMNTPAKEVTMFSGPADGGPHRAGAGPSLAEWWREVEPTEADASEFAPRAIYGRYLHYVFDAIESVLPAEIEIRRRNTRVESLRRDGRGFVLGSSDGRVDYYDRVVLATGHSVPEHDTRSHALATFARGRPKLRHLRADSVADMELRELRGGKPVAVIGLGLSFYDVMASLTIGRGGRFVPGADDELSYVPSRSEPIIVAGSRSGLPLPARGRNQKPFDHVYEPVLFTHERMRVARRAGQLDFERDVEPWLMAEADLVQAATALSRRHGRDLMPVLAAAAAEVDECPREQVSRLAARYGGDDLRPVDLQRAARPFAGSHFDSPAAFQATLLELLRTDTALADLGNVAGPWKAALDVLRDVRDVLRTAVEFGGLTPLSYEEQFVGRFLPAYSLLVAGPPRHRVRQLMALIRAGVVRVVGPEVRITGDSASGRFRICSTVVDNSAVYCDAVIDARISTTDVRRDSSPLTKDLPVASCQNLRQA